MDKIINILSDRFNLDLLQTIKKPYGAKKGFNGKQLLVALLTSSNMDEASNILGYTTRDPVKEAIKSYLHCIPKHGGVNCKWQNVLLYNAGYHKCCGCNIILPLEDFAKLNTRNIGIQALCRKCSFISAKERKAYVEKRTPAWADLDAIHETYHNCPPGYHVDHIIPLRGVYVSGLHTDNNLQYLSAEDNQKKNNKFIPQ